MCIVCGSSSAHLLRALVSRNAPRARFSAQAVAPAVVPPLDPACADGLVGPADVILRGGTILTMADSQAEAIAVRAGRIQAVGRLDDVLAHRGRLTRIIELDGRVLLPGFVNAHWHMPFSLLCDWVDARRESPEVVLAEAVRGAVPGEWIVLCTAAGMAADLDAIAPMNPVVVTNPAGMVLAGNGLADGIPRGRPHVSALLDLFVARLAVSRAPLLRRLKALLRQTVAAGVTCLRVCGLGTLAGADDLEVMRAVMEEAPPLRLRATLDFTLLAEWEAMHLPPGFGDDMFRVDTLSVWLAEASEALIGQTLRRAGAAGWRAIVHAPDAGQLQRALGVFALAGLAGDGRSGIECGTLPAPADVAEMQRLGLSLGLTVRGAAAPVGSLPSLPVSLGMDAATGPSAPLQMVAGNGRALAAVTSDAAKRCGAGEILGSLEVGKYADFAFVTGDPRTGDATCCGTWVNGREMFRA